jgi:hypothetical protein
MRRRTAGLLCLLGVLGVTWLASSKGRRFLSHEPRFAARDSSGIRIAESVYPSAEPGDQWFVDSIALLRVGASDGAEPYLLTAVQGGYILPGDDVVVVDAMARDIRLFNRDGDHIRTFGGRGGGPGKFKSALATALVPPDTILAWDIAQRRLTWFTAGGSVAREVSFASYAAATRIPLVFSPLDWRIAPDGSLVVVTPKMTTRPGMIETSRSMSLILDSGRTGLAFYETPKRQQLLVNGYGMLSPFARPSAFAVGIVPELRVFVAGRVAGWQVDSYDRGGVLREILRAHIPRVPLNRQVVQEARAIVASDRYPEPERTARRTAFEKLNLPDSTPAISDILVDESGWLWVARWSGVGAPDDPVFDVFDIEGRWQRSVKVPANAGDVLAIAADRMLTRAKDSDGVPYVELHAIRKTHRR